MVEADFLRVFQPYYEAFAEGDANRRLDLLRASMTETAEIWGPQRVFSGHSAISEKIAGFHRNWPGCRLVLDTGLNVFLNTARVGGAIVGPDGAVRALGEAVFELAPDGRIQRVLPFWEQFPPLPASWPRELAGPPRPDTGAASPVSRDLPTSQRD